MSCKLALSRTANGLPLVGLTGGIGSGKSALGSLFEQKGIPVIDTDQVAHQLTGPNGKAIDAIEAVFGNAYLSADRSLNRKAMRHLVFSNAAARKQLESILHPMIALEVENWLVDIQQDNQAPYALIMIPLLAETQWFKDRLWRIITVECDLDTQIERVMSRNGLPRDQVIDMISVQASRKQRQSIADDILENVDSLAALSAQVEHLDAYYRDLISTERKRLSS